MSVIDRNYPRLRLVEAIAEPDGERVILRDPTQLAAGVLVVGLAEFCLLSLLDGERPRSEIPVEYARRFGQQVRPSDVDTVLEQLEAAGFLDGPGFERYYARRLQEYRGAPYRPLRDANGFGAPLPALPEYLDAVLAEAVATDNSPLECGGLPPLSYRELAPVADPSVSLAQEPCDADGGKPP